MRVWPAEGVTRIPYWVYTDPELYAREQQRIFGGPCWSYVALECEIPKPGDFVRTCIGEPPVVRGARQPDGAVNVVVNRCAHRGVAFCRARTAHADRFMCPYHQWTYASTAACSACRSARAASTGNRAACRTTSSRREHGLVRLPRRRAPRRRVRVWPATTSSRSRTTSATTMLGYFDRVFDGRALRVLGYLRQRIPANWKLMFENIKDPYHASLLHVFLVTFGLFRADQPRPSQWTRPGATRCWCSQRGEQQPSDGHGATCASFDATSSCTTRACSTR